MNGEGLQLAPGHVYWLIDALYLAEIVEEAARLDRHELVESARRLFEWNPTPFARFELPAANDLYELRVADIVFGDEMDPAYAAQPLHYFSTDAAVLLVIAEMYVPLLIERGFTYEALLECQPSEQPYHESFSGQYWQQLTTKFAPHTAGLIYCPGMNAGFDFIGSGFYRLRLSTSPEA
ncbi:hypothetical protein [Hymenobacter sp. CRA2]|uniref:hypothetical protein n=1 Tax=Hymenobacter sp. CRA2 TaxID=1955620 RepID=UPI001117542F|nr:hypothetical protein [Hymenobacter sp. CRA2]